MVNDLRRKSILSIDRKKLIVTEGGKSLLQYINATQYREVVHKGAEGIMRHTLFPKYKDRWYQTTTLTAILNDLLQRKSSYNAKGIQRHKHIMNELSHIPQGLAMFKDIDPLVNNGIKLGTLARTLD